MKTEIAFHMFPDVERSGGTPWSRQDTKINCVCVFSSVTLGDMRHEVNIRKKELFFAAKITKKSLVRT